MEIETRPSGSALAAIEQLAGSPFGAAIFEAIGQLMVACRMDDAAGTEAVRESPESVLKRISEAPYRFELFAALRLVECAYPELPRLGEAKRPRDEPVRIGQEVSLGFAPADLAA